MTLLFASWEVFWHYLEKPYLRKCKKLRIRILEWLQLNNDELGNTAVLIFAKYLGLFIILHFASFWILRQHFYDFQLARFHSSA